MNGVTSRIPGIALLALGLVVYGSSMLLTVGEGSSRLLGWQCFLMAFQEFPEVFSTSGEYLAKALYIASDWSNAATIVLFLVPIALAARKLFAWSLLVSAPLALVLVLILLKSVPFAFASHAGPILWATGMVLSALGTLCQREATAA
ncbi:MAG: hypothetical protein H0W83_06375 [Planctomycetes bacterium]|nr:hypothetical protein [Planctomycetota bacterium]